MESPVNDNKEFLVRLIDENYQYIYRFVYKCINDAQYAEEITQDTFTEAWKSIDILLSHPNPKRWLVTTARYNVYDHLKWQKKFAEVPLDEVTEWAKHSDVYFRNEPVWFLALLKEQDAQVLRLFYEEGMSLEKIAGQLGVSVPAVKSRLHKARLRLKQKMAVQNK